MKVANYRTGLQDCEPETKLLSNKTAKHWQATGIKLHRICVFFLSFSSTHLLTTVR